VHCYSSKLSERERSAQSRVEIARGEVAMEWEERLMSEMTRLKMELEQVYVEDRNAALNDLKGQHLLENQALATKFKRREEQLGEEVSKSIDRVFMCVSGHIFLISTLISNLFSFFLVLFIYSVHFFLLRYFH
jgi:hypothetical protein